MIIPDDESGTKTFHISRTITKVVIGAGAGLVIMIGLFMYVYIPKLADYDELKMRHDQFTSERLRVLELTRDLERLKQMDDMVRHSLGDKLDVRDRPVIADTVTGAIENIENRISYIDNVPSVAPIQGYISQRSGKSGLFVTRAHNGIDIVAKKGEEILAAASGVVVFSGWTYEHGNSLIIYHGDDYFTHYGHNQQNYKNQMEIVDRGEVIGSVGTTGISSGPHLHFEIWKGFEAMDPLNYFPEFQETDLTSTDG